VTIAELESSTYKCDMCKQAAHEAKRTHMLFDTWEREQSMMVWKTIDRFHLLQQSHPHFVTVSQYMRCQ